MEVGNTTPLCLGKSLGLQRHSLVDSLLPQHSWPSSPPSSLYPYLTAKTAQHVTASHSFPTPCSAPLVTVTPHPFHTDSDITHCTAGIFTCKQCPFCSLLFIISCNCFFYDHQTEHRKVEFKHLIFYVTSMVTNWNTEMLSSNILPFMRLLIHVVCHKCLEFIVHTAGLHTYTHTHTHTHHKHHQYKELQHIFRWEPRNTCK